MGVAELREIADALAASAEKVARRSPAPRDLPFFGLDHPPGVLGRALADLADLGIFRFYSDVLDVSPGWGGPARWLVRRNRCRVTTVHRRGAEAGAARRLTEAAHLSESIFSLEGAVEALPLRTNAFTHVWGVGVLAAAAELEVALHEILRVLRPGGWLAFCEADDGAGRAVDCARAALAASGACELEIRDATHLLEEDSAVAKLVEERVRAAVGSASRRLPPRRLVHVKARKPA